MIYELRTYNVKPGTVELVEDSLAQVLSIREKYSKLAGYWHTEIGPLNQVLHLWPYESFEQMSEVTKSAIKDPSGKWPPQNPENSILEMESELLEPAPFMKPLELPGKWGNIYELRTYTYQVGVMAQVLNVWEESLPFREKYSPLVGAWTSRVGRLNRFHHLWAYQDLNDRTRIRAESVKDPSGKWPPKTRQWMLRQETKILIPASFSPLH